mmetsp:Transcript_43217/g.136623  ORF Transcript_43217/g.136623 Transcript_43217/m.136623 type:complete len:209 (+) Transcript_43217:37-663(+)
MRFQQRRHQPLCHVDADVELTIPLPGGVLGSGFSTETVRLSSARWVGWLPRTAPLPKHDVGRALRAGHAVCGEVVSADDDQQACCSSALWSMLPECESRWAARGDSRSRFEAGCWSVACLARTYSLTRGSSRRCHRRRCCHRHYRRCCCRHRRHRRRCHCGCCSCHRRRRSHRRCRHHRRRHHRRHRRRLHRRRQRCQPLSGRFALGA